MGQTALDRAEGGNRREIIEFLRAYKKRICSERLKQR